MTNSVRFFATLSLFVASVAAAQDGRQPPSSTADTRATDKDQFTLVNPTPRALMRDFNPDRPNQTQGPLTIDAGHLQIEADIASYTLDRRQPHGESHHDQGLLVFDPTFRIGVLNNVEFDIAAVPFQWQQSENPQAHTRDTQTGIGDTVLRAKVNLWGNDQGLTAFALLPFIKIPTNTDHLGNHFVEGGVALPFSVTLPHETTLALMTDVDALHDDIGPGMHANWVNSISLQKGLIKDKLGIYIEYFTVLSGQRHAGPVETIDSGFLYALTPDMQLDAGCNFGVTKSAIDFNPFLGITVRF